MEKFLPIVAVVLCFVVHIESFFSLIAPQKAVYGGVYEVYVTKASRDTEILELVLKLDGIPYDELFNRAITIEEGTKRVSFDLSGQAFQNYTLTAIIAKSNYSQSVEVFVTREKFSALIQTEKLIYSPGDKLKFRVFVLDSKTRLHKIEEGLKFSIIDGVGGIQKPTELKSTDFDGVYEEEFTISESPVLGQWAIKISVGDELIGEETFEVTEVVPPRFYISMNTKPTTLLNENVLKLNVFAKYTHGIFVKGEALVKTTVQSGEQRWQGAMKTMNISTAQTIDFNLKEDLKLSDDMKERIFVWFDVEFAEALTGQKISRKHRTAVCNKLCHQIDLVALKPKVKPGFNYTFQVQVLNLATMQLESGFNAIEVKVLYHFLNPKCSDLAPFDGVATYETTQNSLLKNGIADFSLEIPKNTSGVTTSLYTHQFLYLIIILYKRKQKREKIKKKNVYIS